MRRAGGEKRTIAVGLKIWATFSNRAMEGILGYARQPSRYDFRDMIWTEPEQLPEQLDRIQPDGAILSLTSIEYARIASQLSVDLPLVSIGADTINSRIGIVCSDDERIVSLAVEHLDAAGGGNIAMVGWEGSAGTARRATILRRIRPSADEFHVSLHGPVEDLDAATKRRLRAWLRSLKTPVGIIAWSGAIAGHVLRAAQHEGLAVPQDVSILSLADDRPCLVVDPPISAIDVDGRQLGLRAMSLLEAMMRGEAAPSEPSMVPPAAVIPRGSTAAIERADDPIKAALDYIESNALRGIVIKNILSVIPGVGRTRFYAEFTERVGCSPADHIRQLKINRAKELLRTTELTVTRIAAMCGFASTKQFGDTFKREVGKTPTDFRAGG